MQKHVIHWSPAKVNKSKISDIRTQAAHAQLCEPAPLKPVFQENNEELSLLNYRPYGYVTGAILGNQNGKKIKTISLCI